MTELERNLTNIRITPRNKLTLIYVAEILSVQITCGDRTLPNK